MTRQPLAGKTALVTGASSGLGIDFARQLAQRGASLVLVARREERLRAVQAELQAASPQRVDVIPLDLSVEDAPRQLFDQLQAAGRQIDALVNNAGFGLHGRFTDIPWHKQRQMLQLDLIALTHLTRLFVQDMLPRRSGYILQVASIGAYQPSPTYAVYAAAKTYVLNFSQALNYELRGSGVSVTTVSPGVTATEFLQVAGQAPSLYQRLTMMQSAAVARIGIDAMLRRRASVVTGWFNAVAVRMMYHLLPRGLATAIANLTMTMD
ncbi:MAG: SDR family oxidoreductase [Chloroflexota bacterium]|jgi:short-subunit dehydrogenase